MISIKGERDAKLTTQIIAITIRGFFLECLILIAFSGWQTTNQRFNAIDPKDRVETHVTVI